MVLITIINDYLDMDAYVDIKPVKNYLTRKL